jgi:hypothetical protein
MKFLDIERVLATVKEQLENQKEEREIPHGGLMHSILCETFLHDRRNLVSNSRCALGS